MKTARCSCGQLSITVNGDPEFVAACNCLQCQRRTGSVFGVSAYFKDDQIIAVAGDSVIFKTTSDAGRKVKRNFCPDCGSTVFWKAEALEDKTGIAVGCFNDPNFPPPHVTVWTSSRHAWVKFPEVWPSSETQEFKNQDQG